MAYDLVVLHSSTVGIQLSVVLELKSNVYVESQHKHLTVALEIIASDDIAALQEQLRNTVLETRRPQSAPPASEVHSSAVRSSSDQFRPHTACREPVRSHLVVSLFV